MCKKVFIFTMFAISLSLSAQNGIDEKTKVLMPETNPLELEFKRLAVRRFIFSNNIPLSWFVPSEIVSFPSMHPAFAVSPAGIYNNDTIFTPKIAKGNLVLNKESGKTPVSFFVGGVNPYATYEIDIQSITHDGDKVTEVGFELARLGLRDRVQVLVKSSAAGQGIYLRIYKDTSIEREVKYASVVPQEAFKLRIQLYGCALGLFVETYGETKYLGHVSEQANFSGVLDFRSVKTAGDCTFNIISNLQGEVVVAGARSYLSTGVGQADIRMISYEDLSPYFYQGRLWFTFSCRGIAISQSAQGVLSLDPTVFDIRFEGMIVFDHGDGLLRNDYSAHLFYDRNVGEWRAYACDFGGTAFKDLRSGSGLLTATSSKNPLQGFSVMKARRVETDKIAGHNEDPCIFYDANAKKWRLLTSVLLSNNITSRFFESDTWDGQYTPVGPEITMNSTGTSIQRIGQKQYAFMGGTGNLRVHSYPQLDLLGELNLNLQPHWPKPAGRVWASIVPLPEGHPYRYILLTMDRPNFPNIEGANWSYGAFYFYGAVPQEATSGYEYP